MFHVRSPKQLERFLQSSRLCRKARNLSLTILPGGIDLEEALHQVSAAGLRRLRTLSLFLYAPFKPFSQQQPHSKQICSGIVELAVHDLSEPPWHPASVSELLSLFPTIRHLSLQSAVPTSLDIANAEPARLAHLYCLDLSNAPNTRRKPARVPVPNRILTDRTLRRLSILIVPFVTDISIVPWDITPLKNVRRLYVKTQLPGDDHIFEISDCFPGLTMLAFPVSERSDLFGVLSFLQPSVRRVELAIRPAHLDDHLDSPTSIELLSDANLERCDLTVLIVPADSFAEDWEELYLRPYRDVFNQAGVQLTMRVQRVASLDAYPPDTTGDNEVGGSDGNDDEGRAREDDDDDYEDPDAWRQGGRLPQHLEEDEYDRLFDPVELRGYGDEDD